MHVSWDLPDDDQSQSGDMGGEMERRGGREGGREGEAEKQKRGFISRLKEKQWHGNFHDFKCLFPLLEKLASPIKFHNIITVKASATCTKISPFQINCRFNQSH